MMMAFRRIRGQMRTSLNNIWPDERTPRVVAQGLKASRGLPLSQPEIEFNVPRRENGCDCSANSVILCGAFNTALATCEWRGPRGFVKFKSRHGSNNSTGRLKIKNYDFYLF